MLDSDLAKLYQCVNGTKSINLAVKRYINHVWNIKYIQELYNCKVAIVIKDKSNIDTSNIDSIAKNIKYLR